MPIERYYLQEPLEVNENKVLRGAEFHHLSRVMRARPGDKVEIINGRGVLAQATVRELSKEKALLCIDALEISPSVKIPIILAQAFPKPNRLDFILEKGTELGVNEFWLFPGLLSQKKDFSVNQLERVRTVTIAAMKQCGRLTLPEVKILPELKDWPSLEGTLFFGDLDVNAPLFCDAWPKDTFLSSPIVFFVGPESGWSDGEVKELKSRQATGVKLHENILRTDTASLVAVSLAHHWLMRTHSP